MSRKRIAVNALATYAQTFLSFAVGVFTIRWVYLALGKEMFGLFSAVGAVLGFVSLFNSVLNHSDARFFAIAIGQGRKLGKDHAVRELNEWFNTAFSVHLALSVVLCGILFFAGECAIRHVMVIPAGRMEDSVFVFRVSLFVLFATLMHMPYNALYTAKQYIFVRNLTGMAQTILAVAEAWWLLHYTGNRFTGHGLAHSAVTLLAYAALVFLAVRTFPECRLHVSKWFDRRRIKELAAYSVYAFFDAVGGALHGSGFNLVVNANFGPAANAVIGVGGRISAKLSGLSGAIPSAIAPEIASRVGASDECRAERLAILSGLLSCLPSCFVGIPLLFWMKDAMRVLLENPPEGSDVVVAMLVFRALFGRITSGFQALVLASGKVRGLQLCSAGFKGSAMLLLWLFLRAGLPFLTAVGLAWFIPSTMNALARVHFAVRIVHADSRAFARMALIPLLTGIALSLCSGAAFRLVLGPSFWGSIPCISVTTLVEGFLLWKFHPAPVFRDIPARLVSRFQR